MPKDAKKPVGARGRKNAPKKAAPAKKGPGRPDKRGEFMKTTGGSVRPQRRTHAAPGYAYDEAEDAAYAKRKRAERSQADLQGKSRCPVASRCGGCEWLAMPYQMQLQRKQEHVEELFSNFKCKVDPIVGMENPEGYRNKVQLPLASNPGGGVQWGIFERGSHTIVPCSTCLVEDPRARPIIATVAKLMEELHIKPYNEKTGDGDIRYALVRLAHATGEVMLTLVVNGTRLPSQRPFLDQLLQKHPEITTVVLNVNRARTSVILGDEEKVLMGPGYIEDELCGCRFRISSSSFYQTNPRAAETLYNLAIEMANLKSSDLIGDAYCGTGTIGIVAAKKSGAQLLGVERNPDAVIDARENAELNGIDNAEFITGDAGSVYARMARAGEKLDVVFMDPPRAGSSQAFLANLSRLGPSRVVYISCEPKSQHHDIMALVKNGYQVKRIAPVDMFPHTDHVENIVLLERPPRGTYGRKHSSHGAEGAGPTRGATSGHGGFNKKYRKTSSSH